MQLFYRIFLSVCLFDVYSQILAENTKTCAYFLILTSLLFFDRDSSFIHLTVPNHCTFHLRKYMGHTGVKICLWAGDVAQWHGTCLASTRSWVQFPVLGEKKCELFGQLKNLCIYSGWTFSSTVCKTNSNAICKRGPTLQLSCEEDMRVS